MHSPKRNRIFPKNVTLATKKKLLLYLIYQKGWRRKFPGWFAAQTGQGSASSSLWISWFSPHSCKMAATAPNITPHRTTFSGRNEKEGCSLHHSFVVIEENLSQKSLRSSAIQSFWAEKKNHIPDHRHKENIRFFSLCWKRQILPESKQEKEQLWVSNQRSLVCMLGTMTEKHRSSCGDV